LKDEWRENDPTPAPTFFNWGRCGPVPRRRQSCDGGTPPQFKRGVATATVTGGRTHERGRSPPSCYLRDLPDAELHLLDGGHWLLEMGLDEVVPLMRNFLERMHTTRGAVSPFPQTPS